MLGAVRRGPRADVRKQAFGGLMVQPCRDNGRPGDRKLIRRIGSPCVVSLLLLVDVPALSKIKSSNVEPATFSNVLSLHLRDKRSCPRQQSRANAFGLRTRDLLWAHGKQTNVDGMVSSCKIFKVEIVGDRVQGFHYGVVPSSQLQVRLSRRWHLASELQGC